MDNPPPLKVFFSFYGGKRKIANLYPEPKGDIIVEPFAGSAGYSLLYPEKKVYLYDLDPTIAGIWTWLRDSDPKDILAIPTGVQHTDDLPDWLPQEGRDFVGMWGAKGQSRPLLKASGWSTQQRETDYFSPTIRQRVADQIPRIRHWEITNCSYEDIPVEDFPDDTTWFVDPPYCGQNNGTGYVFGSNGVNFYRLSKFCRSLPGQVIVCEENGADWLPFRVLREINNQGHTKSTEVYWLNEWSE